MKENYALSLSKTLMLVENVQLINPENGDKEGF
jgi:hypothetical protein